MDRTKNFTIPFSLAMPEETRRARRRRKSNEGRLSGRRTREAAKAPQPGLLIPPPKIVYCAEELQSIAN